MSRTKVYFDGYELTSLCRVSNLREPLLTRRVDTIDVPGRDGSLLTGVSLGERSQTVTISLMGRNIEERRAAGRTLAKILAVKDARPFALSIDRGLYHMAIPIADTDGLIAGNATQYDVTFRCLDPVAYGEERTVTVPSGGSVSFLVGGSYPTMPMVSVAAAANAANGYWRLSLDDGEYLQTKIPSGVSTAPVEFDCAGRVLKVSGDVKMLYKLANWLVLEPGRHTLTMTGSGDAVVKFVERWL